MQLGPQEGALKHRRALAMSPAEIVPSPRSHSGRAGIARWSHPEKHPATCTADPTMLARGPPLVLSARKLDDQNDWQPRRRRPQRECEWPVPANVDRSPLTFVAGPGLPQGHQRVDGHERDDERYCDSLFHATLSVGRRHSFQGSRRPLSPHWKPARHGSEGLQRLTRRPWSTYWYWLPKGEDLFSEARRTLVALLFLCRNPRITPAQGSSQGAHCAISICRLLINS
jgi:hypothetical protein